jgi:hypothetical protein
VSAADYLGVCTLDPTVHDEADVNTVTSLFDAVVETRDGEVRVRGLPDVDSSWRSR